jgi:hypothetical protein
MLIQKKKAGLKALQTDIKSAEAAARKPENQKDKVDKIKSAPQAEEPDVFQDAPISLPTPSRPKHIDPLKIILILSSIGLLLLIGFMVHTSNINTNKYYLKASEGALEVWKGTFSPAGKKRLVIMPGVKPPQEIKALYSREEVYPLICEYYIDKADALIRMPAMPDFVGIKAYLNRALIFATTEDHRKAAQIRLNRIDRVIFYYRADVAASRGTFTALEAAMGFLDQAAALHPDEIEAELIEKKKKSIRELLNELKAN